jgi:hypothetical protein
MPRFGAIKRRELIACLRRLDSPALTRVANMNSCRKANFPSLFRILTEPTSAQICWHACYAKPKSIEAVGSDSKHQNPKPLLS